MARHRLELCFDFISPYSYLASTQLDALAARLDAEPVRTPVFLGGIMKETGNRPPAEVPARGAYLFVDVARSAAHLGVPIRMMSRFPQRTLSILRAAHAVRAEASDRYAAFVEAGFAAAWRDDRDLNDPETLVDLARTAGVDADLVVGAPADPRWKTALQEATEAAVAAGAFGAPAWLLSVDGGANELYFGHDRVHLIEARVRRGEPWPPLATG